MNDASQVFRKEQIICKNAALGYEDGIVTENLDFTVNSGDYLCILGENGSGKCTLIKALLGLKPQVKGDISWANGFVAKFIILSSYTLSATSRAVAALFSYRREYGIKGVHGAEGACCVVQEFGSSRKAGASDPQVDVN